MTVACGAGTMVGELDDALLAHGQCVAIPPSGTIGGALAVGRSGVRRLGYGPIRDTVLQVRYVSAAGEVVKAGGATVKNVSGFDLCRLLVGARGTLGFIGDVILRTRPRARFEQWFSGPLDPAEVAARLYRPTAALWDGTTVWVLLEGDERDIAEQVAGLPVQPVAEPPVLPTGGRWSIPPGAYGTLSGRFVVELGVGVVHHEDPPPARAVDPVLARPPPPNQAALRPDRPVEPWRRRPRCPGWLTGRSSIVHPDRWTRCGGRRRGRRTSGGCRRPSSCGSG